MASHYPRPVDLTQYRPSPGVIDLSWGHPDPSLLPIQQLKAATVRALDRYGADMLGYGNPAGPPPLIEFICERLALTDARAPTPAEVVITSGASQGLDLAATFLLEPGDTVLVDVPTYHLAVRILRDYPIELVGVRSDDDGIVLEDLARTITRLRAGGRAPKLLYTIPTFHNPTGRTLPDDRRAGLLALAGAGRAAHRRGRHVSRTVVRRSGAGLAVGVRYRLVRGPARQLRQVGVARPARGVRDRQTGNRGAHGCERPL